MLEINSLVDGKYRILKMIDKGGMSVIYLAQNERVNKTWAIKEVRKDITKDFEVIRQSLIVETDILKNLSHRNLVEIVDIIEDDSKFLIVMDYIEGKSLKWHIDEYGAQSQEDVIAWAKQMCDVLGYLHSRDPAIIHRDVKPGNIMLEPDGKLVLIDFGTAKEYKEWKTADTVSMGTIGYAAPEQYGKQARTDNRTDIYCLGTTLYHLVTGKDPTQPPYEMLPIRQINPNLSEGLEQIILKCTQRSPENRYQSCEELLYALEHYEEIDARFRNQQRKRLRLFILSSIMTVLFLAAGIVSQYLSYRYNADDYREYLEQAQKSTNQSEQMQLFQNAIEIKPEESDAYLRLAEVMKEDSEFSQEEEEILISCVKNYKGELLKSSEAYAGICFEIGKLYWYYYQYGNTKDNRESRMKTAVNWFSDALLYGGDQFENWNMALIYKEIGTFYREVPSKAIEGADKGLYAPLFEKLRELMNTVRENADESEIVKLELYELVRYSIMQYTTKFKIDGVKKSAIVETLEKVAEDLGQIVATTEKTEEMKAGTMQLMDDTFQAIEIAYGT